MWACRDAAIASCGAVDGVAVTRSGVVPNSRDGLGATGTARTGLRPMNAIVMELEVKVGFVLCSTRRARLHAPSACNLPVTAMLTK